LRSRRLIVQEGQASGSLRSFAERQLYIGVEQKRGAGCATEEIGSHGSAGTYRLEDGTAIATVIGYIGIGNYKQLLRVVEDAGGVS
jgi:hypothetical protein